MRHNTEARHTAYIEYGVINAPRGKMSQASMRQFKISLSLICVCWHLSTPVLPHTSSLAWTLFQIVLNLQTCWKSERTIVHCNNAFAAESQVWYQLQSLPSGLLMVFCMIYVDSRDRSEILAEWFKAGMRNTEGLTHMCTGLLSCALSTRWSTYIRQIAAIRSLILSSSFLKAHSLVSLGEGIWGLVRPDSYLRFWVFVTWNRSECFWFW